MPPAALGVGPPPPLPAAVICLCRFFHNSWGFDILSVLREVFNVVVKLDVGGDELEILEGKVRNSQSLLVHFPSSPHFQLDIETKPPSSVPQHREPRNTNSKGLLSTSRAVLDFWGKVNEIRIARNTFPKTSVPFLPSVKVPSDQTFTFLKTLQSQDHCDLSQTFSQN